VRSLPRLLGAAAAAVALSLLASACDTSPYAATVGNQTIQQTALNVELADLSANHAYIAGVDSDSGGLTVAGAAPGTYSSTWTAHVLTGMIEADAVHEALAARGELPDGALLTAARTVEAANYQSLWLGFPASYRDTLTERTAELAAIEPPSTPASEIATAYHRFSHYFFSRVCVRTAAIPVTGPAGSTGAYSEALALAGRIDAAGARHALSPRLGGTVDCYDPVQFETQTASFDSTVLGLAVGRAAAPEKTSYGYQVIAVASRRLLPLAGPLRRVLSAVISSTSTSAAVEDVLAHTRVVVNPLYGEWKKDGSAGYVVVAPTTPTS
jgi:hypothetical protein